MKHGCLNCRGETCTRKVSIFSALSDEELREIASMIVRKNYEKGETIFLEGMESNTLYIVNKGRIKLFKYTKDGKEQILHILSEGEFFGELNLLKKGEYSFNAQAVIPTRLCTLSKEKIRKIILEKPEIGLKILEAVARRLSKLETLVKNLATNDVDARVAHLLLDLKDEYGRVTVEGIEINLPLTREDMSNYTGVARETISRKLKKFEDEGIIKLVGNKKILLLDEEELEKYTV
ncbi:Crp/Fnr family transcriptional regulator [Thermohalobacter berrensis]|uniref:Crp/Fnr family transcriptional regulator n=1 Tax=Thermohalobacter berrensis TaxID=99594 RepID=A0A419T309_9FIRM|nr:Crp/Fnr family transcriptional regulator [Thermohalobacter berrensis]RKD31934.1 Crp/Fnr family transcriptional regulator [Thermohalobacter berrensis]